MIEISERFLSDCGGWQVLREARSFHDAGRVVEAAYEPPVLQGRVRTGESEVRAGLRILTKSNVENLCTCRESRREGRICAHSIAVGLEWLRPHAAAPAPAPNLPGQSAQTADAPLAEARGPKFSTEAGEPAALSVVLPGNFLAAWDKGSLTIGCEAELGKRRVLLSALDPAKCYRVDARDFAIVEKLRSLFGGTLPGAGTFAPAVFVELLGVLGGHPRVTYGRGASAAIREQGMSLTSAPPDGARVLTAGNQAWMYDKGEFTRILVIAAPPAPTSAGMAASPLLQGAPAPDGFALKVEGSLRHLVASLSVRYGDRDFTVEAQRPRKNAPAEIAAIERLRTAGFAGPDARAEFVIKGEPAILGFFARHLPALQREWKVETGARFEHVTKDVERIEPRLEIRSSGENWLEMNFELGTSSGGRFSAAEIQRLLQSGQNTVRKKDGKLAVFDPAMLEEFAQVLRDCEPDQRQPGQYRIHNRNAAYLASTAEAIGAEVQGDAAWKKLTATAGNTRVDPVALGDLEPVLRPYQKEGVYWLHFLMRNSLGGILADEMGLGKTVQMLALLRSLQGRSLVVCPASLVFNWEREARRFAPTLQTTAITGPERLATLAGSKAASQLLITSYPLLRRDADHYRSLEFDAVVLDEAQHIKNPDTQNAQAACAIRARHRFALTGTPIENSVRDLWSLMQFLMPGFLGKRDDFRERYEKEIESAPGGAAQQRLNRRLRPFILRRRKRDVIMELPEKLVQVAYCELQREQRDLYTSLLGEARKQADALAGEKSGQARILVLTALLRLRQICCDPRLLAKSEAAPAGSAKVELFAELLEEIIDGGHRVLVFSQFVAMLGILREQLDQSGVEYCYLDGQTRDRAAVVDRFQKGNTPVFLISLKAGGTGLNLTAADTVIHFDPWWNPAVEAQATDRAHRIGQKSVVTSYKLIARDTVEEKILTLQARKQGILDATLETEEPMMTELSASELRELLE